MIEIINNWLEGIVIAVVVSVIIEMIIPEGKNKKYIKTIIGVYIMFVIVSPIVSNIGNLNAEELLKATSEEYAMEIETINFNKEMQLAYEGKLKENIEAELNNIGYSIEEFSADYEVTENEFGNINNLNIHVKKVNDNSVKIVKEVKINLNQENTNQKNSITQEEIEKIKTILSENCGISIDKIKINGG